MHKNKNLDAFGGALSVHPIAGGAGSSPPMALGPEQLALLLNHQGWWSSLFPRSQRSWLSPGNPRARGAVISRPGLEELTFPAQPWTEFCAPTD